MVDVHSVSLVLMPGTYFLSMSCVPAEQLRTDIVTVLSLTL